MPAGLCICVLGWQCVSVSSKRQSKGHSEGKGKGKGKEGLGEEGRGRDKEAQILSFGTKGRFCLGVTITHTGEKGMHWQCKQEEGICV